MAHELTQTAAGVYEFAHVGARAWHGLGQQLTVGASIEEWRKAAGMEWNIRRAVARYFADPDSARDLSMMMEYPDRTVLFRSDNLRPLGLVSPEYEIVQPAQVLEFFRDLVSDQGMQLESAGTMFGGKRFFALAKMGEQDVMAGDKVGGYLLLSTSADGTLATEARQTTIRVVCNNTLTAARNEKGGKVAPVKFTHSTKFDDKRVKEQLGLSRDNFDRGMQDLRTLAQIPVSQACAEDFVRRLLRPEEYAIEQTQKQVAAQLEAARAIAAASGQTGSGVTDFAALLAAPVRLSDVTDAPKAKRAPKGEDNILNLFASTAIGGTMAGAAGTAWGLVNAVTEHVDHHAQAKTPDHRMSSAWFGAGEDLKARALDMALTTLR